VEAATLLVGTSLIGVLYGYLYLKTGNLWAPWTAHTINNTVLNLLHVQTADSLDPDATVLFAVVGVGYLALLPWTRVLAR
jgi:membrane protease YdiL (CAAX protease family)